MYGGLIGDFNLEETCQYKNGIENKLHVGALVFKLIIFQTVYVKIKKKWHFELTYSLGMAMGWGGEAFPIPHPTKKFCLHFSPHVPINLVGVGMGNPHVGMIFLSPPHSPFAYFIIGINI